MATTTMLNNADDTSFGNKIDKRNYYSKIFYWRGSLQERYNLLNKGTITLDAASLTGDLRLLTSSTGGSQYARGAIPSGAPFHVCVSVRGECRAGKVETTSELFVKGTKRSSKITPILYGSPIF